MLIHNRVLKKILLGIPLAKKISLALTSQEPRIFMYHRFSRHEASAGERVDAKSFDWQMSQLSGSWNVITVSGYFDMLDCGEKPRNVVILTIDDGYRDFCEIAFPILRKYNFPGTFFPTIDFLNGQWLWWDKIDYAITNSSEETVAFEFNGKKIELMLRSDSERETGKKLLKKLYQSLDNNSALSFLDRLGEFLGVKIPEKPTDEYAPVTWEQTQEVARDGIEIGSHSMSHPYMKKFDREPVRYEIRKSRQTLEEKLGHPIDVFCYPNGTIDDATEMVVDELKKSGYRCALLSVPNNSSDIHRYLVPRFSAKVDKTDFLWKLYGMESLSSRFKRFFGFHRQDRVSIVRPIHLILQTLRKLSRRMFSLVKDTLINVLPARAIVSLKKFYFPYRLKKIKEDFEPDAKFIKRFVKPNDTVLDVGANIGVYTCYLSRLVGAGGRVVSFEPIGETFELLSSNIKKLNLKNINAFNRGVSDRRASLVMEVPTFSSGTDNYYEARIVDSADSSSSHKQHNITTVTLDSLLDSPDAPLNGKDVSFIKMDVEGHELQAINGAVSLIRKYKPVLFIEVSGNPDSDASPASSLFRTLLDEGYRPYLPDGDNLRERKKGDVSINYFFLAANHTTDHK